jgi:two-component system, sensor histidine kinase
MTLWLRKRPANYDGDRHSAPTSSQAGELRIAREESVSSGDRTRAEQIRILYRTGPVGVVGAAVAAVVLAGLLQSLGSSALLGTEVWLACLVLVVAGHLALCRRYWRAAPADTAWRPWARWFTLFSAAEGTIWGVASMSLTTPGQLDQHLLVLLVAATIVSGAVAAYGSYLPAFYALLLPAIVPYGIASVGGHGPFDHAKRCWSRHISLRLPRWQ